MRHISNAEIAEVLSEIGEYLEMQGVAFKPRAYEKVAEIIGAMEAPIVDIYKDGGLQALGKIEGVGKSIAGAIEELITKGKIAFHEELKKEIPVDLAGLRRVEGLGPKSIKKLYEALNIKNRKDLARAAHKGLIAQLDGFGKKSEEKILTNLAFTEKASERTPLGVALPQVREVVSRLASLRGVEKVVIAGSLRRERETVGDADILVVSDDAEPVMKAFVAQEGVAQVFAEGPTKSSVRTKSGLQIDLRVVPKESYGAALNYFTGSKDHNVALRQLAIKKGLKLNEYGLYRGTKQIAGKTEEELYRALGMEYIAPELRENTGELEAARKGTLPALVTLKDIKGDLQVQTDWTDGTASIEAMARAAASRGLEYIAITDHTKRLAMTHGLDEERIVRQWVEIDRVNKKLKNAGIKMRVLKGTECDILKDGSLDLGDKILSQLEVVGISVHSYFDMKEEEQTKRIVRAMTNPYAHILFHPTGRLIGKRKPYEINMDEIIRTAKKENMILEINASPDRLDLRDEHIRLALAGGIKMTIDSDAHAIPHFSFLEYGVSQARRGWAEKKDIINVLPVEKMLQFVRS